MSTMHTLKSMCLMLVAASVPFCANAMSRDLKPRSLAELNVLRYVASCALAKGAQVHALFEGKSYVLEGELGYAPRLFESDATVVDERRTSACVLARTNAFGVVVPIELIPIRESATDRANLASSPSLEGTFFGNLFAQPPTKYVCVPDHDLSTTQRLRHQRRVCALPDVHQAGLSECGFVHVGRCSEDVLVQDGVDYSSTAFATRVVADAADAGAVAPPFTE